MDGLRGAHQEVEAAGGKALILHTDVADPAQVERAAEAVENRFGPIDIWINNAMTSVFSPVKEMQAEEYQRVTNVTYLGAVYGTLSALRRMLPRNRGTIVQVGSALASRSIPLQSAYCAAKHAMAGFTDSLRCELLHDNSKVRLTMVQLPAMNTPQFGWVKSRLTHKAQPVPPIFQPEVGARGIYWAAHHAPRELLIGGPTVEAVEGNKFFPGLADRYLARTGYKSQQTAEQEDPNRPDNLWEPVAGDHGAHGTFGNRSRNFSYELWAATHKGLLAAVFGSAFALVASGMLVRREREKQREAPQQLAA
jgi:NAD(P)-dependent dehydrogenase (short-subunit alcohol dehydrogenase family)